MRISSIGTLVVAALMAVALFNPQPVLADGTDPTLAAHGTDIVRLDERIWSLEQAVKELKAADESAPEPPPLLTVPEPVVETPVYDSCKDLPADVVCQDEMPTPVNISGLEDGLANLWVAFGNMEIICGEDSGLACYEALSAIETKVTTFETKVTTIHEALANHESRLQAVEAEQKWKFGGQIGLSGVMAKGIELDGVGDTTSGYGLVGGVIWESGRFGLGLSGNVERVSAGQLSGVHAAAKARAAYRLRRGVNVGFGLVAFDTTSLQDSDGVKRLEFNGSGAELFIGQSWGISATRFNWNLGLTVPVQHGSAYGQYYSMGLNGVIVGGEFKVTFGGDR